MKNASLISIALAAALLANASAVQAASKVEKVDMVAEGIDLKPVVVRNNGDYTSFENGEHKYLLRLFAKARGGNTIAKAEVLTSWPGEQATKNHTIAFTQSTPDDGWGVYKKSITPILKFSDTNWTTDPRRACKDNLTARVKAGMKREDVLKKEWKLTTHAKFSFFAYGTTKAQARKGQFGTGDIEAARALYTVPVLCRAK